MLQVYSSAEIGRRNLLNPLQSPSISSTCNPQAVLSPFKCASFLGFSLNNLSCSAKKRYSLHSVTPCSFADQIPKRKFSLVRKKQNGGGKVISSGFKLQCHFQARVLPTRSKINGGKKRYGGELPSILRSLDTGEDVEKILDIYYGKLSPKEQTVILKEQRSWDKVVRVFEWMKSQKEYIPNAIHYNVVLRALGLAQRWDELRLRWIEMAKNGVLPTNNTYGMLVDVYGKAGLLQEALLWIKHMKLRGIFPDEVTMTTVVRVLKEAREYDRADRFYKNWRIGSMETDDLDFDSMADSRHREGLEPISLKHFILTELFKNGGRNSGGNKLSSPNMEITNRKPRLTATYNTLIDLYGKAARLKDAADVFGEMIKSGVVPDTITFNTMIFICGSQGYISEAESLLSKMEERRIYPDTKTYNILLCMYAGVGNTDAALQCYRKIRKVGLFPDVVSHRSILQILCQRKMVHEVKAVIEEMEMLNIRLDEHSLPVIIRMYIDEGLMESAKALFEKASLDGGLSSKTYAAIMDVYAEKELYAEAESVFFSKRNPVRQKDLVEYNVMVKAYGKAKLYDKALSLFRGMKNHGTWPDECTYNSLIQMFSGGDLVDQARDLLSEMQAAAFRPRCQTFSAVIGSYVRLGKLSDAVDVYEDMFRVGIEPNEVVYGSLINGFAESGKVEEAFRYFRIMSDSGISGNQIVLTSLIKAYNKIGYAEGAKRLYDKMKTSEGGVDIVASNSMLNLYADHGMISEARLVFDDMKEKGWADGVSFATMIYLYRNMGMLDEAIESAEEMRQSGFLMDCVSFNKVMACYATCGQLNECARLLHEMVNRKLLPDSGTFKTLFIVLKKGGIPHEAVRQLELSYQEGKPYARQAIMTYVFSVVGLHNFALESCEVFTKADFSLDCSVYNVAIYAYGASGKIDKSLNMFMRMQDEGLKPDIVTYINLAGCYGKAGMVEGVKRIHSQLKHREIEPNETLLKAIMDAYDKANRHDLAELVDQEMRFVFDATQNTDSEAEYESDESSTFL